MYAIVLVLMVVRGGGRLLLRRICSGDVAVVAFTTVLHHSVHAIQVASKVSIAQAYTHNTFET